MDQITVVMLPRSFQRKLKIIHIIPISLGTFSATMGVASWINSEIAGHFSLTFAGLTLLLAGFMGLYATLRKSFTFHPVSLGMAILSLYFGLIAFNFTMLLLQASSSLPSKSEDGAVYSLRPKDSKQIDQISFGNVSLILTDIFAVFFNICGSVLIIAIQIIVIYFCRSKQMMTSTSSSNPEQTELQQNHMSL